MVANSLPTLCGVPPKLTAVTGLARVSAPRRSAASGALPLKTLPATVLSALVVPSTTLLLSARAVGVSSTIWTVSVPLVVMPPRSVTSRAIRSLLSVAPGWFSAALRV